MIRQQAVPARGDRHSECVQGGKGTLVVADQCLVNVWSYIIDGFVFGHYRLALFRDNTQTDDSFAISRR